MCRVHLPTTYEFRLSLVFQCYLSLFSAFSACRLSTHGEMPKTPCKIAAVIYHMCECVGATPNQFPFNGKAHNSTLLHPFKRHETKRHEWCNALSCRFKFIYYFIFDCVSFRLCVNLHAKRMFRFVVNCDMEFMMCEFFQWAENCC